MFNIFKKAIKIKPKSKFELLTDKLVASPGSFFFGEIESAATDLIKQSHFEPNALFVGAMGSGKSVSAFASILSHTVANPNGLVIVLDTLTGATDFLPLFAYQRVLPFVNDPRFVSGIIELLYSELHQRMNLFNQAKASNYLDYNKQTNSNLAPITLVWEQAHCLNSVLNYDIDEKNPGTDAGKFKTLMRLGRSYGLNIFLVSQKSTSSDISASLLSSICNICAFRVSRAEANYLGLPDAANLTSSDKGVAYHSGGRIKFPYISTEEAKDIIALEQKKNDSVPYLASVNETGLKQLKTNPSAILSPKFYKTLTMLDEAAVMEDLEFWDFVENGPKKKT